MIKLNTFMHLLHLFGKLLIFSISFGLRKIVILRRLTLVLRAAAFLRTIPLATLIFWAWRLVFFFTVVHHLWFNQVFVIWTAFSILISFSHSICMRNLQLWRGDSIAWLKAITWCHRQNPSIWINNDLLTMVISRRSNTTRLHFRLRLDTLAARCWCRISVCVWKWAWCKLRGVSIDDNNLSCVSNSRLSLFLFRLAFFRLFHSVNSQLLFTIFQRSRASFGFSLGTKQLIFKFEFRGEHALTTFSFKAFLRLKVCQFNMKV